MKKFVAAVAYGLTYKVAYSGIFGLVAFLVNYILPRSVSEKFPELGWACFGDAGAKIKNEQIENIQVVFDIAN